MNRAWLAALCGLVVAFQASPGTVEFYPTDAQASFRQMAEYLARDGGRWIGDNPNHDGSPRSPHSFGLWFEHDVNGYFLEIRIVAHYADRDVVGSRGHWAWNPQSEELTYRVIDRGGGVTEGVTTFPDIDTFITSTTRITRDGATEHRDTNDIVGPDEHHNETFRFENGEWISGGLYVWRRVQPGS